MTGRFNPNHVPSGPDGGQFTSGDGGGGDGAGDGGATGAGGYSEPQLAALNQWASQTSSYQDINGYLRDPGSFAAADDGLGAGSAQDIQATVAQMDAAFAATPPLSQDVTVYRGISADGIAALTGSADTNSLVGQTITDQGFTSTTLDDSLAWDFADGGAVLAIQVPAGASAIDFTSAPFDDPKDELEVLLPRGSSFAVGSVDANSGLISATLVTK